MKGTPVLFTLITTAPDATETRSTPIAHGPALMLAVARTLREAAPWVDSRQARRLGLVVARSGVGVTSVEPVTGYRFRIERLATVQTVAV